MVWRFWQRNARAEINKDIQTYQDVLTLIQEALDQNGRISETTLQSVEVHHQRGALVAATPLELRNFLIAVLLNEQAAYGIYLLRETNLLADFLPHLVANEGIQQGGLHHLDVLEHSIEALRQLIRFFPEADLKLRLATLLHDVGKASCLEIDEREQTSFYGHAEKGALLSVQMLERLGFEDAFIAKVESLVHYHMLPLPRNSKGAKRFAQKRQVLLPDLLQLMIADREAARGKLSSEASRKAYRLSVARVLEAIELAQQEPDKQLLTGEEIMRLLNLSAGPKIGHAVRFLKEATAAGDIRSKEEAEAAILHFAQKQAW